MKEAFKILFKDFRKWSLELQVLFFMALGLALIIWYQSHYRQTLDNKEQAREAVEEYLELSESFKVLENEVARLSHALGRLGIEPDSVLLPAIEDQILRIGEKEGALRSLPLLNETDRNRLKSLIQDCIEGAHQEIVRWEATHLAGKAGADWREPFIQFSSEMLDKKAAHIQDLHKKGQDHDHRDKLFNFLIITIFSILMLLAVIVVFRELKRTRRADESLNQALEAAKSAALAKEQFLANMSHEIRTPLNAILGYSSFLEGSPLNPAQQEFARGIESAGQALLAIVNDILDLSKLEAGMVRFESIPFHLEGLMHSVEQMFQHQARDKGLGLYIHPLQDVPEIVAGDPTRLTQMLANLISNAIKFTSRGRVDIWVKNIREDEQGTWLSFKVQDTGIGIPRDKLETIFERFEQASADTTRKFGGAGLGLPIVRKLAELQGGHIYVRSRENRSSTFYLELPFRIPGEEEATSYPPAGSLAPLLPSQIEGLDILVVEDNPMNQRITSLMLNRWGLPHTLAANGQEAIGRLKERPFSLVLMDLQMPVMDGYAAAREIRRLGMKVPIIAMTAHAMPGEREKCLASGMNGHLSKPIREQELQQAVLRHALRPPTDGSPPPVEIAIDYDYLMEVAGGSKSELAELARIFLGQAPMEIEKLRTALQGERFTELAAIAHSMRSTVAYMGMEGALGKLLQNLESAVGADAPDQAKLRAMADKACQRMETAMQKVREEVLPLCEE